MSTLHRSGARRSSLGHFEQLESREMLSAHALGAAVMPAASFLNSVDSHLVHDAQVIARNLTARVANLPAQVPNLSSEFANISSELANLSSDLANLSSEFAQFGNHLAFGNQTHFTATLSDPSNAAATGTISYQTGLVQGATQTTLAVNVNGATANSTLNVNVGGTTVGTLTTDANGAGSLVLSSNPTGTEQALPTNFPTSIAGGTTVSVGTLSGTLATQFNNSHGLLHQNLTANLTDSTNTSATGTIAYHTSLVHGVPQTTFSANVTGAAANSTVDVVVGSTTVGTITTDATGAGSLMFSSNPTGAQLALPTNFPTSIAAGTTVSVGSSSGTLTSTGYSAFHHIWHRH